MPLRLAPELGTEPVAAGPVTLTLQASFAGDDKPIRSGLVWRLYGLKAGQSPELVAKLEAPLPTTTVPSGTYLVHLSYGLATEIKRLRLVPGAVTERMVINAGALRLGGVITGAVGDGAIAPGRLSFQVFQPQPNDNEGRLVATAVKAGELVRLPEGTYHVVSTYGDSNAIMRADLKVDAGRVTQATLNHRAATVTLKLVAATGGEAFAGTAFSVLTPGGDVIREAIGAFPTVTLAEGEYLAIARNGGKVYNREFKVTSGLDEDVEIMARP